MVQPETLTGSRPSLLIVGAGSVGQVFGRHLALGGARVSYLARPKHLDEAARGFDLYPLNSWRTGRPPVHFVADAVMSSLDELKKQRFDLVMLTLSSAALREAQLGDLLSAIGDATLVSLQPDAEDHVLIEKAWGTSARLVCGGIGLIAFSAPLPGQSGFAKPGTAYWFPPFVRSVFSGPRERCLDVVAALRRGSLPATIHRDVPRALAFPNAVGMTYLTALEAAGWSVSALRNSPLLAPCERGVREAIAIVRHRVGSAPLGLGLSARSPLVALGLWLGARLTPFPLLPYLERHFTKVSAQTHLIVGRLIAEGEASGLSTTSLKRLLEAVTTSGSPL